MKHCLPRILAPLAAASLVACAHSAGPAASHHPGPGGPQAAAPTASASPAAAAAAEQEFANLLGQLRTDHRLDRQAAAVADLTLLAQRWPERLKSLPPEFVLQIVGDSNHLPHPANLALLRALYDAQWQLRWGIEPSSSWLRLTRLLLEQGALAEAIQVSLRITDTHDLIAMRADRRFDAVVAANPERFDIDAAATRQLRTLQAASEHAPQSLQLKSELIGALLQQQHYAAMLALSDAVLLEIESTNYPEKLYVDFNEQHGWFLNERAIALERFGRWDEAVAQLTAATAVKEQAQIAGQLINLGELYCALERPRDALSAIGKVPIATLSSYGLMEMESVRLDAASQLGDTKQAENALDYLRENRAHDPASYQYALVTMNRLDDAAQALIEWLRDADHRLTALASVQTYSDPPMTPRETLIFARERSLLSRPDVLAVIQEVGRVERYPVEE
jgi:tetratricopeptide (TPR) repeat protein